MAWNPDQYEKFKREREQPFHDLLAMVRRREGLRVADLGCGTGELTAKLHDALPMSAVLGIDSSAEMLARAKAREGLRFELRKIEDLDGEWDLIFSNAAIHWVDDHARLLENFWSRLRAGGQLAVQLPSNHEHPGALAVAAEAGWARPSPVLRVDEYAKILWRLGGVDLNVFEKVYAHTLPDSDAMLEWMRGTTLLPYLERIPVEERDGFVERVGARYRRQFPERPLFFGFRRILFTASRVESSASRTE